MTEHEDIQSIMEEPPSGENHGRTTDGDRQVELGTDAAQATEFMRSRGFGIVETSRGSGTGPTLGAGDAGMTAHRGVLHPDEYVDGHELQRLVEAELGYTYAQVRAVYRQGPKSPEQRKQRGVIDARMLALRRSGANIAELGRAIGFAISPDGHCRTLDNAIARAKANSQWFKNLSAAAKS